MRPLIIALFFLVPGELARSHHSAEHTYLASWIPQSCCVTSDCCYRIAATEIAPAGNDSWRIKQTGQVVKRTAWSPDGATYRCACRLESGGYVQDRSAHTYCIFPPQQSVSR